MSVSDMEGLEELSQEDEELYSLSDDELEARFKANKEDATVEQSDTVEEEESNELDEETEDKPEETTEEDSVEDNEESEDSEDNESEEQSEEDVEPEGDKPDASESREFKPLRANGMDIPIKSEEELYQMASMGVNYKTKMAHLAPHRRKVDFMVENGLTEEDLTLLADIKQGNKEALAKVLKDSEIDALDLDTDNVNYQSTKVMATDTELDIRDIVQDISNDTEYAMTKRIVDTEWDDKSREMIRDNPSIVRALHSDVKDGTYAKVLPEAMRLEMLDLANGNPTKSKLEYSIIATKAYREQEMKAKEAEMTKQAENKARVAKKKKAAAPTRSRATKEVTQEKDAFDMTEEEFNQWYEEKLRSF